MEEDIHPSKLYRREIDNLFRESIDISQEVLKSVMDLKFQKILF